MRHRHALRHQLAEDERQIGDRYDDEDERTFVGIGLDARVPPQYYREVFGEDSAAVYTGEDADQRDADLQEESSAVGFSSSRSATRAPRSPASAPHAQPRFAGGNQRQLRPRKEAIEEDQREDRAGFSPVHRWQYCISTRPPGGQGDLSDDGAGSFVFTSLT